MLGIRKRAIEVELTQGQVALVDEPIEGKWCANYDPKLRGYYAVRNVRVGDKRPKQRMHRYIWERAHGPIPKGMQVDHTNRNSLDNRLSNLRVVTHRVNAQNRRDNVGGEGTSRHPGVVWNKRDGVWAARLRFEGRNYGIYWGTSEREASAVYKWNCEYIQTSEGQEYFRLRGEMLDAKREARQRMREEAI
jgi:hypothetical protein